MKVKKKKKKSYFHLGKLNHHRFDVNCLGLPVLPAGSPTTLICVPSEDSLQHFVLVLEA
jgi:hypothetical protein